METAPTIFGILADSVPIGFQVLAACVFLVLALSLLWLGLQAADASGRRQGRRHFLRVDVGRRLLQ